MDFLLSSDMGMTAGSSNLQIDISDTVSYTHLDVYKRQEQSTDDITEEQAEADVVKLFVFDKMCIRDSLDIDCASLYLYNICISVFISHKGGKLFRAVLIRKDTVDCTSDRVIPVTVCNAGITGSLL